MTIQMIDDIMTIQMIDVIMTIKTVTMSGWILYIVNYFNEKKKLSLSRRIRMPKEVPWCQKIYFRTKVIYLKIQIYFIYLPFQFAPIHQKILNMRKRSSNLSFNEWIRHVLHSTGTLQTTGQDFYKILVCYHGLSLGPMLFCQRNSFVNGCMCVTNYLSITILKEFLWEQWYEAEHICLRHMPVANLKEEWLEI